MSEQTPSTRELARRIGVSHTALQKAERTGRILREPSGLWDVEKTRQRLAATATPNTPTSSPDGTPFARLKVAQLALKVEAQRLALDQEKGRLIDTRTADRSIDEIVGSMRDALLTWPARVSGLIAANLGADPHLVQTVLQQHITDLLTEAANRFDPPRIGDGAADH
jgi:hypothetical protein